MDLTASVSIYDSTKGVMVPTELKMHKITYTSDDPSGVGWMLGQVEHYFSFLLQLSQHFIVPLQTHLKAHINTGA